VPYINTIAQGQSFSTSNWQAWRE